MIDKLRELSTSVYAAKPQLVMKHSVPAAFRLLEDNRADLRPGTVQLLRMLHVLLGPQLFWRDFATLKPDAFAFGLGYLHSDHCGRNKLGRAYE